MVTKEKINRINELARASKQRALTELEKIEQQKLRAEYILSFKKSFVKQLECIEIVD